MLLPPPAGIVHPPREELEADAEAMGTNRSIIMAPETKQAKTIDPNHATQANRSNHHGYVQKRDDSHNKSHGYALKRNAADSHMYRD